MDERDSHFPSSLSSYLAPWEDENNNTNKSDEDDEKDDDDDDDDDITLLHFYLWNP